MMNMPVVSLSAGAYEAPPPPDAMLCKKGMRSHLQEAAGAEHMWGTRG